MFKDSVIYLLGRYSTALLGVLTIAVFTRVMDPEQYAQYALAISAAAAGYAFLLQWLRLAIGRFLPGETDGRDVLLSQARYLLLIIGGTSLLVGSTAVVMGDEVSRLLIAGSIVVFVLMGLAEVGLAIVQSDLRAAQFSTLTFGRAGVTLLLGGLLAWAGAGAPGALVGAAAGHLLIGIVAGLPLLARTACGFQLQVTRRLLGFGLVIALGGGFQALQVFGERFILLQFAGLQATGAYSAAFDLASRTLMVLLSAVTLAGAPRIYRAYDSGGMAEARPALRRQAQVLMGLGFPAAVVMFICPSFVVKLILGTQFQDLAVQIVPTLILASCLNAVQTGYFEYSFSLTQRLWWQTGVIGLATVGSLALALFLVPKLGPQGAAQARALGALFGLGLAVLLSFRVLMLPVPWRDLLAVGCGCLVIAFILTPFSSETAPQVILPAWAAAAAAYGLILAASDAAGSRTALRKAFTRLFAPRR
jgi:O-antigen/teichoic acid export membrane protein